MELGSTSSAVGGYTLSGVGSLTVLGNAGNYAQILLGGAWGPQFANFYVGALWVKQPNTPVAGQPPKSSFSCQFAFGLNLTVSGFANLKK